MDFERAAAVARRLIPYAIRVGEQVHVTEADVSTPPAAHITDARGQLWILGLATAPRGRTPNGEYAFDVLCNGMPTGEVASRIEMKRERIRIFTCDGWKWHRQVNGQHIFI